MLTFMVAQVHEVITKLHSKKSRMTQRTNTNTNTKAKALNIAALDPYEQPELYIQLITFASWKEACLQI